MPIKYNNSAGRLLEFLRLALTQVDGTDTAAVWANVFSANIDDPGRKIHPGNYPEIFRCLVQLGDALTDTEIAVKAMFPDNYGLYCFEFENMRMGLASNHLRGNWGECKAFFTPAAILALEHCAKDLPKEGEVTKDELQGILDAVHELREQVRQSTLSKALKEWILGLLDAVERSVEHYSIRGGHKLKEALATLLGQLVLHGGPLKEIEANDPTIVQRILGVVRLMNESVRNAQSVGTLIEYGVVSGDFILKLTGNG